MHSFFVTTLLLLTASLSDGCLFPRDVQGMPKKAKYSYSGMTGATHWHLLSEDYKLCGAGKRQSPVNVDTTHKEFRKVTNITLSWPDNKDWDVMRNGHTVELLPQDNPETYTVIIEEQKFELLQCHFHTPGEHWIDGKSFPVEMHCVLEHVISMYCRVC
jgi:carbonic anhydrase